MNALEQRLQAALKRRREQDTFRSLRINPEGTIDFTSNDYFGLARSNTFTEQLAEQLHMANRVGSAGSRLLSGNYGLTNEVETMLATAHQAEAVLLFNSGYDANIGLFSTVATRNEVIFYDETCHASIKDGARLSQAKSFSFKHNDLDHLETRLKASDKTAIVAVEALYSMDGDQPNLVAMLDLCERYGASLVVDEAHSTGVFGEGGAGLCASLGISDRIFARTHTFGKAIGAHGACVAGSQLLRDYLINNARTFIYTTALPSASLLAIRHAYGELAKHWHEWQSALRQRISYYLEAVGQLPVQRLDSDSQIQGVILPTPARVKSAAASLQQQGLDVRAIVSPTVPKGRERIRICLHTFNSNEEIDRLSNALREVVETDSQ